MSAYLGPIHYWLYNKIRLQEAWIRDILELSAQEGRLTISGETLDSVCGRLELLPLEEMIDEGNIHGWLQERIEITETRLAFLVTELLKEDASRLPDLQQAANQFGKKHAVLNGIGAEEVLRAMEDTLLDGMPCDHVNQVLESETDKVVWRKTQCVHREYWERVSGDVAVYDALREEIIAGMLTHSDLEFHALRNNEYEISREGR